MIDVSIRDLPNNTCHDNELAREVSPYGFYPSAYSSATAAINDSVKQKMFKTTSYEINYTVESTKLVNPAMKESRLSEGTASK